MRSAPTGPRRGNIHLAPATRAGLWAARLLVAFLAGLVVYISLAGAYQISTGEEAVDSVWFRVPLMGVVLTTAVAGVLAGVAAAFSVFRRGERSVLMFLAFTVLVLVVIVFGGEFVAHVVLGND